MNRLLLAVGFATLLTGCAASYRSSPLTTRSEPLNRDLAVYVAIPADGGYGAKVSMGSGQMAAQSLARALTENGIKVSLGAAVEQPEKSLISARNSGAGYVADLVLTNWENRATAWSGRPSRLSTSVRIRNAATGETVDASTLDSRSRYITLTSTSPESLLLGSMRGYVNVLYPPSK